MLIRVLLCLGLVVLSSAKKDAKECEGWCLNENSGAPLTLPERPIFGPGYAARKVWLWWWSLAVRRARVG